MIFRCSKPQHDRHEQGDQFSSNRCPPPLAGTFSFMIQLTHDPIDYTALTEQVRSDQAGAVVLFLGTVREMTEGRQAVALDYEAFPQMAEAKLAELLDEARGRWPIVN